MNILIFMLLSLFCETQNKTFSSMFKLCTNFRHWSLKSKYWSTTFLTCLWLWPCEVHPFSLPSKTLYLVNSLKSPVGDMTNLRSNYLEEYCATSREGHGTLETLYSPIIYFSNRKGYGCFEQKRSQSIEIIKQLNHVAMCLFSANTCNTKPLGGAAQCSIRLFDCERSVGSLQALQDRQHAFMRELTLLLWGTQGLKFQVMEYIASSPPGYGYINVIVFH